MFDTDLSDGVDLYHVVDLLEINGQLYGDKVDELSIEQHIDSWLESNRFEIAIKRCEG